MPSPVGTIVQFIGGAIGRVAGTALVIGIFFVLFGVTPWEFVARLIYSPPSWATSPYFRLGVLILGVAVIWASLAFNRWSWKQKAIDGLAEDISWAIDNLLNRKNPAQLDKKFVDDWQNDFKKWCDDVSGKLGNRAFFTRADQLHFDYLGFIEPVQMHIDAQLNRLLGQLRLKIERLRDVINWTQQTRR
jgi:hypothetical protein